MLEQEGGKEFTYNESARFYNEAVSALEGAAPQGIAGDALKDLALSLVNRQS
jgi:hypothetical protein